MNIEITTSPTGRSPENKYFFGHKTKCLDMSRPKYNKIGNEQDFKTFYNQMCGLKYNHSLVFYTCGLCFRVETNDNRHAQFVRNMFTVEETGLPYTADWTIIHNTDLEVPEPKIHVHLDEQIMLIAGTTFLGEIKKGVFGIVSFVTPRRDILPMHCAAFTYNDEELMSTNLMFGLSGTGKTTLSSDPNYRLISDDEVIWLDGGIDMIETGCYAKSEGLTPETHKTIFDAVEAARDTDCLVVENPGAANARLCYPLSCVENSYCPLTPFPQRTFADIAPGQLPFDHPNNIFFLTMDATGVFPALSKISGDTVRKFFETGYTSQMPGTEAGSDEIKKTFSPCYGSPFMPRPVSVYSDMLMKRIDDTGANVYLVNTGMDETGTRYPLEYTRKCIQDAIMFGCEDNSKEILDKLLILLSE